MQPLNTFMAFDKSTATDILFHLACGLFSSLIFAIDVLIQTGIADGVPYVAVFAGLRGLSGSPCPGG